VEGPDGIQLDVAIGSTDRGSLWRATRRRQHDRIVRIVEPRFCDGRFRQALTHLRQRQHPRLIEITGEGWSGAHFYIEYAVTPPWRTLAERLAELDSWRDRLLELKRVCEVLALWHNSPVHPLGLNLRSIVLMQDAGRWYPWLLPCPATSVPLPCDLFGVEPPVLAALAPEVIRGVQLDQRAQDSYALGTLVAQAVGGLESSPADDESLIEAQARGALLDSAAAGSTLPDGLRSTPQVQRLLQIIRRYRHTAPNARPTDAHALQSALEEVTDAVALAGMLRADDPALALDVLSEVTPGHDIAFYLKCVRLAAEICVERGDLREAVRRLDAAILIAPELTDLRRQRGDLRWTLFEMALRASGDDTWTERDDMLLLKDLNLLKRLSSGGDHTLPYLRAAEVHRRRGDLEAAADELFEATQIDPSDLLALFCYARCWRELKEPAKAAKVANTARRRIDRLEELNMITSMEAHRWREDFDDFPR
jgi:tetratricopeptide (TPR) repeat protein